MPIAECAAGAGGVPQNKREEPSTTAKIERKYRMWNLQGLERWRATNPWKPEYAYLTMGQYITLSNIVLLFYVAITYSLAQLSRLRPGKSAFLIPSVILRSRLLPARRRQARRRISTHEIKRSPRLAAF